MTLQRIGRVYGWKGKEVASITDDDAAAMLHDIADQRGMKPMRFSTLDLGGQRRSARPRWSCEHHSRSGAVISDTSG